MVRGGALEEVEAMLASGIEPSHTAARILGLAECIACLRGELDRDGLRGRHRAALVAVRPAAARLDAAHSRPRCSSTRRDGAERNAARLSSLLA